MKVKFCNLAAVEGVLWGMSMGLFLSLFVSKYCPVSGETNYWILFLGYGLLFASFVLNAIRERNPRKK
jgi:hypothetical protein